MNAPKENDPNYAAYRRLKKTIDETHPRGWFLAIVDDKIAAAAADFRALEARLRAQGKDPRAVLVVEAGVDYPECVTIFV